jgi:hypothetical protein
MAMVFAQALSNICGPDINITAGNYCKISEEEIKEWLDAGYMRIAQPTEITEYAKMFLKDFTKYKAPG